MNEDDPIRITFRMPASLRDALALAAEANTRSMNAEIIARLERSFERDEPRHASSQASEIDPVFLAEIERRAAEWGCSKTQALIRMTLEEMQGQGK